MGDGENTNVPHKVSLLAAADWRFVPGVSSTAEGLRVAKTDLSIVEQDGSGGQPNPPINLGMHLEETGDFALTATLKDVTDKPASLQLYGEVPIIADEFRMERKSVRLAVTRTQLIATTWDGTSQTAAATQTFALPNASQQALTLTRQGEMLQLSAGGTQLGTLDSKDILASNRLWFGVDSAQDSWLLSGLTAEAQQGGTVKMVATSDLTAPAHDPDGLQYLAHKKRADFTVGAAMAPTTVTTDPAYAALALDSNQVGSWTPENAMKMQFLQPQEGHYYFQQADLLVHLAEQNGIAVHGHALVFGEANPHWLTALPVATAADKQHVAQLMEQHITTVMQHFGNKVGSWDVVNEPLADFDTFDPSQGNILRNHKWYQAMGEDYIAKAFRAAYQANPDAQLFINEYGLEFDGERWDTFVQLMTTLKAQLIACGVPIDHLGVGFQAHVYEAGDKIDPVVLKRHITQLGALGFKTQISEMDVYNDEGDAVQGAQYAAVFNACITEPNCIAWRTWTLADRYDVWKDDAGAIQFGKDGLFGSDLAPRPGYAQIQKILHQ
ncbi:MAG TPA: endo-1,4-beta-xylanase [Candidatus Saccharimonadales bacterium]|nr:endo-1,4-beta-xylanase [Candidatus Saccharimonadales bacterium]